jgi:hypothetical protein
LRACFGHFRIADDELRLRCAFPVLGHVDGAVRIVERRLGDEVLIEERLSAPEGPAGELDVGTLSFDAILSAALRPFERRGAARDRLGPRTWRAIDLSSSARISPANNAVDIDAQSSLMIH